MAGGDARPVDEHQALAVRGDKQLAAAHEGRLHERAADLAHERMARPPPPRHATAHQIAPRQIAPRQICIASREGDRISPDLRRTSPDLHRSSQGRAPTVEQLPREALE